MKRILSWIVLAGVAWCVRGPAAGVAQEPVAEFLEALRTQGYYDAAEWYLDTLQQKPYVPPEVKQTIPYELGLTALSAANQTRDLKRRMETLDRAADYFRRFLKQSPKHPSAPDAKLQLGNVEVSRAEGTLIQAEQTDDPAEKKKLIQQGHQLYEGALKMFQTAAAELEKRYRIYPPASPDPKVREARRKAYSDWAKARLLWGQTEFQFALHFEEKNPRRKQLLEQARERFHTLYVHNRTRFLGQMARLFEGRCYQEMGRLREALSAFQDVIEVAEVVTGSPAFRNLMNKAVALQLEVWNDPRQAKYEAVLEQGTKWLENTLGEEDRSQEGLLIAYQTARAADALIKKWEKDPKHKKDIPKLRRELVRVLRPVIRVPNPNRDAARTLLAKYEKLSDQPVDFADARDRATLMIETAQEKQGELDAELAKGKNADQNKVKQLRREIQAEWENALKMLRTALDLRDESTTLEDIHTIRFRMAYIHYQLGHYYDAAVLGQYQARFYPTAPNSLDCAKIALRSYLDAYNQESVDARPFHARKLVEVAEMLARRWPNDPTSDLAWMLLGKLAARDGNYQQAIQYYDRVASDSPQRPLADLESGALLWSWYLRRLTDKEADPAQRDQLLKQAQTRMEKGVAALKDQQVSYSRLSGVLSLAQLYLVQGRAADALKLLQSPQGPLAVVANADPVIRDKPKFVEETYKAALRAYVGVRQMDKAKEIMGRLRQMVQQEGGADQQRAQRLMAIYASLGRDLERQIAALKNDSSKQQELKTLVQGFESILGEIAANQQASPGMLHWVAETFLSMGKGLTGVQGTSADSTKYFARAAEAYQRLIATMQSTRPEAVPTLQVRLAHCLRQQGKFKEAINLLLKVLQEKPSALDAQKEAAYTFQHWGRQSKDTRRYQQAMAGYLSKKTRKRIIWGWAYMSTILQRQEKLRSDFHEARYNLALCHYELAELQKDPARKNEYLKRASKDIAITYRLFPEMGGADWRPQYDRLLKRIQRALGEPTTGLLALKQKQTEERQRQQEQAPSPDSKTPVAANTPSPPQQPGSGTGGPSQPSSTQTEGGGINMLLWFAIVVVGLGAAVAVPIFMHKKQRRRRKALLTPLLLLALLAPGRAGADSIHLKDGKELTGTIPQGGITRTEIKIQRAGKTETVPVNQIQWISLDQKEPPALRTVRRLVVNGNYDMALRNFERYKDLDPGNVKDLLVKQEVEFYKALALAGKALQSGDENALKEAGKAMTTFLNNNQGSWHYFEANEMIGRLLSALNRPDRAVEYYAKLEEAPWPDVKLRGKVLQAQSLLRQKKADQALGQFQQVINQAQGKPELNSLLLSATVGKAEALAAQGKFDQAVPLLEGIVAKASPTDYELRARLYNALGRCHLAANKPREALLAFLHVDLLYHRSAEQHAEALYHLIQLWRKLGRPERADEAHARLMTRYKSSPWAKASP